MKNEMKYSVYVLKSLKNGKRYVGTTGKDPKDRFLEHESGTNKYTRDNRPLSLVYYEKGYCKRCSLLREKFLKSGQGRKLLDKIGE